MPTYKVKAPDGRSVTLRGDTLPTDADLDGIFASLPAKKSVMPKGNYAQEFIRGARGISPLGFIPTSGEEALDIAKVAGRQLIPGARETNVGVFEQGPIGGGLNLAGIRKAKGLIPAPSTGYGKGFESSADIAQTALALKAVAPALKAGMNAYKLNRAGGPTGAIKKAEDELIRILQPQVKKLNIASKKGLETPEAITKSIPYVKPSKSYEEVATNLGQSKKSAIKSRNKIIRGENYKISDEYLLPLQDEIDFLKRQPQTPSTIKEIEEMDKVLGAYQKFNQERGFNRIQAQAAKVRLQRETEPLLKKLSAGENIQRSPAEIKALDKVRHGLMKMVEGGNPEVKRLNEAFAALQETEGLARNQANLARKTTPTLLEKVPVVRDVLNVIARSRAYPEQVALRALNVQPSLKGRTKEIAKLFELAQEANRKPSVMPKDPNLQIEGRRRPPMLIPGPQRGKALPVSPDFGPEGSFGPADPEAFVDFANKFFQAKGNKIETIAEAAAMGKRSMSPKKAGLNPFTGEYKAGKPKTALQAALARFRKR